MAAFSLAELRQLPDEELIQRHDALAKSADENVNTYRRELARRDQDRQTAQMLRYTEQMLDYTREVASLTMTIQRLTIAITILTVITAVATIVALLR